MMAVLRMLLAILLVGGGSFVSLTGKTAGPPAPLPGGWFVCDDGITSGNFTWTECGCHNMSIWNADNGYYGPYLGSCLPVKQYFPSVCHNAGFFSSCMY